MAQLPRNSVVSWLANPYSRAAPPITAAPITTLVRVFAFSDIRPLRALAMIEMPITSRMIGMMFLTPQSTTPLVFTVGPAAASTAPSTDTAITPSLGNPIYGRTRTHKRGRANAHSHRSSRIVPDPDHHVAPESRWQCVNLELTVTLAGSRAICPAVSDDPLLTVVDLTDL